MDLLGYIQEEIELLKKDHIVDRDVYQRIHQARLMESQDL
jgi:hypothetical protein